MFISDKEQNKRMRLYNKGLVDREIAEEVNISINGIYQWRKRNDLPANENHKLTKKEHQERMELYDKGLTDKEIAKKINISIKAVAEWRKRNDLSSNYEDNKKISDSTKNEIFDYYYLGFNDREIAEKLNISFGFVCYFRKKNNLPSHKFSTSGLEENEHQRRLKLYKQGLNDREISEKVGITRSGITNWRKRNNLEANNNYKLTKKEHQKRMELYKQGLTDPEIAEKAGEKKTTISSWRNNNNLEPNSTNGIKLSKEEHQKRLKLYNEGLTDNEIANERNVSTSSIYTWRTNNELPNNYSKKLEQKNNKRMELYNKGLYDKEIAKILNEDNTTICHWRKDNNLESNYKKERS